MHFNGFKVAWNDIPIIRDRFTIPEPTVGRIDQEVIRRTMRKLAATWTRSQGAAGQLRNEAGQMCVQGALLDHLGLLRPGRQMGGTHETMLLLGLYGEPTPHLWRALSMALNINDSTGGDWRLAAWGFEMILDGRMTEEDIFHMTLAEQTKAATKFQKDHGLAA